MNKVSVIVPVYNKEKYLENCINSILGQTYDNIELILINDGSKDNSWEIIKSLHEKHKDKIIIENKENGGVASARNRGLDLAQGDYIMFLDADDYIDNDCIEKLIEKVMETQADIIRFRLCLVLKNGIKRYEKPDYSNNFYINKEGFKKHIYKNMLSGIKFNSICRVLFDRKIIEHIRFREDMLIAEDLLFAMQAFTCANSFLYLSNVFYYYNQTEGSLTGSGISVIKKYKYNMIITREQLKYLKSWDMNKVKYKLLTLSRVLVVTLSKIKRILTDR